MAFRQAAASLGARNNEVLSADNAIPERHIIITTLRNAAPLMGLKASVIATLDAMLSCLPPKRNHHTVFASNLTLTFRRNGISDRTIRRHAAVLQELGLLIRRDSPNKKRFSRHNSHEGKSLRFGFDLSPLFERLQEIASHAAEAVQIKELLDYLATAFIEHDYDIKWLMREIVNSDTYQRSWHTNATNEFDLRNFSHAPDILDPVGLGESQIAIEPLPHVVAIEQIGVATAFVQAPV